MNVILAEPRWRFVVLVDWYRGAFRTRLLAATLAVAFMVAFTSAARASEPPPSGRTFDTLNVRGTTYTRVTVVDITKRHVSFRSAQGFATVLIEDLEPDVVTQIRTGTPAAVTAEPPAKPVSAAAKTGKALPVHARETSPDQADEDGAGDDDDLADTPIEWTVRTVIAASIFCVGALGIFVAQIWLLCVGFQKSVAWGIILLFGSFFAELVFCLSHWDVAKRPTLLTLAGVLVAAVGAKMWGG